MFRVFRLRGIDLAVFGGAGGVRQHAPQSVRLGFRAAKPVFVAAFHFIRAQNFPAINHQIRQPRRQVFDHDRRLIRFVFNLTLWDYSNGITYVARFGDTRRRRFGRRHLPFWAMRNYCRVARAGFAARRPFWQSAFVIAVKNREFKFVILAGFSSGQVTGIFQLRSPAGQRMSFAMNVAGDVPHFRPAFARLVLPVSQVVPEPVRAVRNTRIADYPAINRECIVWTQAGRAGERGCGSLRVHL